MKTLIVYSSKYGATKKCAEKIGKALGKDVLVINLKREKVPTLNSYDKVIIGSSVYAGMLRKEVKAFCKANESILKTKKLAVFLSCFDTAGVARYIKENLPLALVEEIKVTGCCGGVMDFKKMNFFERFMVRQISKMQKGEGGMLPDLTDKDYVETITDEQIEVFVKAIDTL